MYKIREIVIFAVSIFILIVVVSNLSKCDSRHAEPEIQHDTIYLHDTIKDVRLDSVEVVKWKSYPIKIYDTITNDSIVRDTIEVQIPLSKFTFDTTLTDTRINGTIQGFEVELKELTATNYRTTTTIKEQCKRKRWGIGVQAGFGIGTNNNTFYASPYVGIGISYNIINF